MAVVHGAMGFILLQNFFFPVKMQGLKSQLMLNETSHFEKMEKERSNEYIRDSNVSTIFSPIMQWYQLKLTHCLWKGSQRRRKRKKLIWTKIQTLIIGSDRRWGKRGHSSLYGIVTGIARENKKVTHYKVIACFVKVLPYRKVKEVLRTILTLHKK